MNHTTHDTYRTACGRGRATYRPDWDSAAPWILYVNGSCMRHVMSLQAADTYFLSRLLEPLDTSRKHRIYSGGERVLTPHGAGIIYELEKVDRTPWAELRTWYWSGRYGVKLDGKPDGKSPICCSSGVAYYWPNELKDAS